MKVFNIICRLVLGLLVLFPILGVLGIFPPPTQDMYSTSVAFSFINILNQTGYIMYIMAIVFALSFVLIVMNRMALVALLILPIVVNILAFHLYLDGGLFTKGALLADVFALLNIYFLWQNRRHYKVLLIKSA